MLAAIYNTFCNCFKIPELKSRILFTLMVLAICRLEAVVRIPGLDGTSPAELLCQQGRLGERSSVLGMYSLFTGGALEHCAVGALGIMPYISATIIIQLLTAVIPTLSKLAREEGGRTKIIQYGRYLTVLLCLGQGMVMAIGWENPEKLFPGWNTAERLVLYSDAHIWFYRLQTLLMLTTGTMLLMWLGEQITERGIGNGVSLVITIGILARLPQAAVALKDMFFPGGGVEAKFNFGHAIALVLLLAGVIAGRHRHHPGAAESAGPIRPAGGGPQSLFGRHFVHAAASQLLGRHADHFRPGDPDVSAEDISVPGPEPQREVLQGDRAWRSNEGAFLYMVLYGLMILFFSYFWVATQFNELQIADDLKKNGGYIPGRAPGPGDERLSAQCHEPDYAGGRDLSDHYRPDSDLAISRN